MNKRVKIAAIATAVFVVIAISLGLYFGITAGNRGKIESIKINAMGSSVSLASMKASDGKHPFIINGN